MPDLPDELLALTPLKIEGELGKYEEHILKHQITPFHLVFGLVPEGLQMETFQDIRLEYLTRIDRRELFNQLPSFKVIDKSSTSAHIKAYMSWTGISVGKLNSLPDLTFDSFVKGLMGPILGASDIDVIRRKCEEITDRWKSFCKDECLRFSSTCDSLVQKLSELKGTRIHLLTIFYYNPYAVTSLEGTPKCLDMTTFKTPYLNHDEIIDKGIMKVVKEYFLKHCPTFTLPAQQVYSPWVRLTNAAGTGKSRAIFELGNITNVLYFNFKDSSHMEKSVVGQVILEFLEDKKTESDRLTMTHVLYHIIHRLLYMCRSVDKVMTLKGCMIVDVVVENYVESLALLPKHQSLRKMSFKEKVGVILLEGLREHIKFQEKAIHEFDKYEPDDFLAPVDVLWSFTVESKSDGGCGESLESIAQSNEAWLFQRARLLNPTCDVEDFEVEHLKPVLFIVFDDAERLLTEYRTDATVKFKKFAQDGFYKVTEEQLETYRFIKDMVRFFGFYWKCMFVTVSSVSKTDHLFMTDNHSSWRPPRISRYMHKPIILKGTIDILRDKLYTADSETNWMDFVFSERRVRHIASLGRPSWSIIISEHVSKSFPSKLEKESSPYAELVPKNVVDYFRSCILRYSRPTYNEMAPILSLAVGLSSFPTDLDQSQLTYAGVFILSDFTRPGGLNLAYIPRCEPVSEGFHNGFGAFLMVTNYEMLIYWLVLSVKEKDSGFLSREQIGDLIGRMSVLFAVKTADRTRTAEHLNIEKLRPISYDVSRFVFEPLGLEDFLEECAGKAATDMYLEFAPELKGSFMSFSHFIYADVNKDLYGVLADALARGVAVIPQKSTKTAGMLFIPLVLSDGRLSFICWNSSVGNKVEEHPSVEYLQQYCPQNQFQDLLDADRPYAYIFKNINGDLGIKCKVYPRPPLVIRRVVTTQKVDIEALERVEYCNLSHDENEIGAKRKAAQYSPHHPCLSISGSFSTGTHDKRVTDSLTNLCSSLQVSRVSS